MEKGRRDASAAVAALAEERRLTALGLGAPMAPPGEQLSPEQPQPRPRVGVASPSPLHARKGGADAAAHSAPPLADAACVARDGVGRALALQTADSEAVLESLAALHARLQAAGAQLRRAAGALRASAQTRGSAQGEAARLCAELQVRRRTGRDAPEAACRASTSSAHARASAPLRARGAQVALAQLGSERERSALLSETCEKLIRGATAARAPSGRPRAQARPQPAQIAAAEAPALGAAVEAARAPGEPLALSAQPMAQRGPTASGRAFGSISE